MKTRSLLVGLLLAWPAIMAGQSASGAAFGVSVRTATIDQQTPSAMLPADGSLAQTAASDVTVDGYVTAQDAFAAASGATDAASSDAVCTATLERVSILNGLITADGVTAISSSTAGNTDTHGSTLANLVVNGVQISDPAPNTRVTLPGVGYVVLNEQIAKPGGVTVNMIHVVLQQSVLGTSQTIGDIVVGSASSGVN